MVLDYKRADIKKIMSETSYVVVFPSIFSKNKIPQLIKNIKKILRIKNQSFNSVKRDGEIILINANDPVFASSAISLLFGIEKIAIARQTKNNFQEIVSEITLIGGNLLLKGEKFLVKVEGTSKGFLTKDIEIASTSEIIEKKSNLGARPGTEEDHNKLLYTYLTKENAYVCIFMDKGMSGIPYATQKEKTICAIYDEISAISCFETIKQGYDTQIVVCYRESNELTNLVKMINQILPRLVENKISLDFFQIKMSSKGIKNYQKLLRIVSEILLTYPNKHISLPLSPLMFSLEQMEKILNKIFKSKKIPIIPLAGLDTNLFADAKEIGMGPNVNKIEKLFAAKSIQFDDISNKELDSILNTKKVIDVIVGPNNVHDILDSFEENH